MEYYKRSNCRLCMGTDLEKVVHLEPSPIADAFVPRNLLAADQPCYPLDLYFCHDCCHVQLLDVIDPEVLFKNYIYETKSSPGLVNHFKAYAADIKNKFGSLENRNILDIGSNDGTLLRFFRDYKMNVLGVDAAVDIAAKATRSGIETLAGFFDAAMADDIAKRYRMDIITANNVYAHADNLGDITRGVRKLLKPDGVFVFEVSWLLDLIQNRVFDFIYHEHLCYHSIISLEKFFRTHGLMIFDVHRVPTKGGSIRCYAKPDTSTRPVSSRVRQYAEKELAMGLDKPDAYTAFESQINGIKAAVLQRVSQITDCGRTIWGYGASATTTTLIYHFGLTRTLECLVDDNKDRQGLFSPGCHIPVVSPEKIYEKNPDYLFITAWRFADAIIEKHGEFLKRGGHFIVPLPEIKEI
jgi:SAM-dependent methyltransferase